MQDTLQNISHVLNNLQRSGNEVLGSVFGAATMRRKSMESVGDYLACDGLCLPLQQVSEAVKRARAA